MRLIRKFKGMELVRGPSLYCVVWVMFARAKDKPTLSEGNVCWSKGEADFVRGEDTILAKSSLPF